MALLLVLGAGAATLPTIPPVRLSAAWTSIPLPDTPLGIAAHGDELWVCGANEMLAVSKDGGRNWTLEHERKGGEMLFTIAFADPQRIEAFGSAGAWLESADGGASWKRKRISPDGGLDQVALGSDRVAYGANADQFAWSTDGDKDWEFRVIRSAKPDSDMDGEVIQVGALDAQHAVVLFAANKGEPQPVIATASSGRSWIQSSFPSQWTWTSVRADAHGYSLYGDYQNTGAEAARAMASSPDGLHWTLGKAPGEDYSDCTRQGCLIPGGWADLTRATPQLWQVPDDRAYPMTDAWASAGQVFCRVSAQLRCRVGLQAWRASPALDDLPKHLSGSLTAARCQTCPGPQYPEAARYRHRQGMVALHGLMDKNGRLRELTVRAAPSAELAQAALAAVSGWVYHPLLDNGQPREVETSIHINFTLGGG